MNREIIKIKVNHEQNSQKVKKLEDSKIQVMPIYLKQKNEMNEIKR